MWIADSYAKINLGLNILNSPSVLKYNYETGLCFIDWRDRFEIEQANEMRVNVSDESGSKAIFQATEALTRYIGLKNKYHINVVKRVPSVAGLGDSSSKAALTLRMLNKIEKLGLSDNDLTDLGRGLGRDTAFFIRGETGISSSNQEFEPLNIQPDCWIVTCFPDEENAPRLVSQINELQSASEFSLKKTLTEEPVEEWRYMLFNDFEQAVFQQAPLAGNLKDQFYEFGAVYASMVGRGTAVYGLFDQNFVAVDAYKTLINLGYSANITQPLFKPDYGIYKKG